jgi:tetratricopeptide (TPR) repeat protein
MVQVIQLGTEIVDPALEPWKDFAGRWQSWRSRFNRHHWPESWQGQAYQADRLVFPSPWDDEDLITRFSLRQGLLFGYVLQQNKRRALLLPGYLGAGHELEAIYLIQEQVLLHFPCSLAGSDWFLQVINVLLPELLSRPAVPPELVQAPLQLRIEGHPNFAHCLLNTYTCLEDFLPEINTRLQVVGAQPFGPIDALFPECQWVLSPAGHEREEIEFELPLSHRPNQINHSLRRRIQGFAEKCSTGDHEDFEERLTTWKSNGGWILWVSLKTRGAVAHGLEEFIAQLLKELAFRQCAPLLLLDGFSYQSGDTSEDIYYGLSIQELLVEELEQANTIRKLIQVEGCKIEIIEAIGLPLLKSIKLASFADFYVCHQGTVQHKIGWTCWDTPGVVHSNLTRWRSGIHEWGGMGGKAPTWMPKEAIAEYQDAKNQNAIDSNNPRRPYQINCQFAIKSVIECLEQNGVVPLGENKTTSLFERAAVASKSKDDQRLDDIFNLANSPDIELTALDLVKIGIIYRDIGRTEHSQALFLKAIDSKPSEVAAHYELAIQKIHEGDHSEAIKILRNSLDHSPHDIRTILLYARVLYINAQQNEAVSILNTIPIEETLTCKETYKDLSVIYSFGRYLSIWTKQNTFKALEKLESSSNYINFSKVHDLILNAMKEKIGFCLIRMGDGEGAFITKSTTDESEFKSLYSYGRVDRARVWVGDEAEHMDCHYLTQLLRIKNILKESDILGIPYKSWLEHEFRIGSMCGITSLSSIINSCVGISSFLCTQQIHHDLYNSGLLSSLIRQTSEIGLISCHRDLPANMMKVFSLSSIEYHFISGELGHKNYLPDEAINGKHYPDQFNTINCSISRPLNGKLFLVAAGILGKFYCHTIKRNGGIALDIGSIADGWMNCDTRPGLGKLPLE